ncbi:MAG TPA: hypothetical protein VKW70_10115, partial [Terriglobia bacterium]|nr:hypothetical protein [Terriglobia bacterium]
LPRGILCVFRVTGKTHKAPALRAGRKKDLETILLDIADDLRDERSAAKRSEESPHLENATNHFVELDSNI